MKSNMFYLMGFYSEKDHSSTTTANKSYYGTKLRLSCLIQKNLQAYLLMTPALIYNPNSKQVEMLLISKLKFTENQWEAMIAPAIQGDTFHLQTGILIEPDGAASCIDRLISNQIKIHRGNNPSLHNTNDIKVEDVFLDAYRLGTNGLMHHLDHRPWKMKKSNILRLHKLQDSVETSLGEGIAQRKSIAHQIQMRQIIFEHANMFLKRDPVKYGDTVLLVLEDHDLEVKRLMDQEIDVTSDMDILYKKSEQIIKVLKRQVEIQTMFAKKRITKRNNNEDNNTNQKKKRTLQSDVSQT